MITDIMNIYAPAGSKVVFAYPKNGYPCDGERAKEYGLEVWGLKARISELDGAP